MSPRTADPRSPLAATSRVVLRMPDLGRPKPPTATTKLAAAPTGTSPPPSKETKSTSDALPVKESARPGAGSRKWTLLLRQPAVLLCFLIVAVSLVASAVMQLRQRNKSPGPSEHLTAAAGAGNSKKPGIGEAPGDIMKVPELSLTPSGSQQASQGALPTNFSGQNADDSPMRIERLPPVRLEDGAPAGPALYPAQAVRPNVESTLAPGMARLEHRIEPTSTEGNHEPSRPVLY